MGGRESAGTSEAVIIVLNIANFHEVYRIICVLELLSGGLV